VSVCEQVAKLLRWSLFGVGVNRVILKYETCTLDIITKKHHFLFLISVDRWRFWKWWGNKYNYTQSMWSRNWTLW